MNLDTQRMSKSELVFFVNGVKVVEKNADPETTLLQYLRKKLGLTGAKLGCGEGGCGACTVMVSRYDHHCKKIHHYSVNACLAPLCSMHGLAVTTVEGIGSVKYGLHPVQERLAKSHGSQCGFCTPGIIMSMYTLLRNNPQPSIEHMEKAFEGNLCRCTGYRPILDGFRTFTKEYCQLGEKCCRNVNNNMQLEDGPPMELFNKKDFLPFDPTQDPIFPPELQKLSEYMDEESLEYRGERVVWYRPSSLQALLELKFTYPDARLVVGNTEIGVEMKFKNMLYPTLIAPTHIAELVDITHTDRGIRFGAAVTLSKIDEELKMALDNYPEHQTRVFAAVIEMLRWFAGHQIRNVAAVAGNIITASPIADLNPLFLAAGATLEVQSKSEGAQSVLMDKTFFISYRKTVLKPDEIVINILLPFTSKVNNATLLEHSRENAAVEELCHEEKCMNTIYKSTSVNEYVSVTLHDYTGYVDCKCDEVLNKETQTMSSGVCCSTPTVCTDEVPVLQTRTVGTQTEFSMIKTSNHSVQVKNQDLTIEDTPNVNTDEYFYGYKQAYRREDDIATVNAGMRVLFKDNSNIIKEMTLAYGGMSVVTVMPTKTMEAVIGREWNDSLVQDVCHLLAEDLPLEPGAPGGMVEYRRTLTTSFFFKFYLTVQLQLQAMHISEINKVPSYFESATCKFHRNSSTSTQVYQEVASGQLEHDLVGRPVPHVSALKQATGEAVYIDDMPKYQNELYAAFVTSTKAYANIVSVDPSAALTMPGVKDYICHKDVPGHNVWGTVVQDEEIFASMQVLCQGQIIGLIVADTQVHAQRAAKCVKVQYEELEPIITIKDAIKAGSYYSTPISIHCGDVDCAFQNVDHVLKGEHHMGGQEHFYLETNAVVAVPKLEDGEMELFVTTQNPTETQHAAAEALGIPANRVFVRVKRLGGGFGGKQSRSIVFSTPCAVAANKLGCPVRMMLDRDEDMLMSGTRHPFYAKYKVGFTNNGKIVAMELELYSNSGMSLDLSYAVMGKALMHCENAYKIPNLRCTGYLCKTNIPSNTAFRGFGGPQGMMMAEQIITDISEMLQKPPVTIREINLYQDGDRTHYEQELSPCFIQHCWDECLKQSDYSRRKKEVEIFNSENRWKKRGITVVPTKFGISYEILHLNQAGALVHIYHDGSVLLMHSGVEMGQGLHTKMIQVASRVLGISSSKIHISETGTNTVPNTSATAASISSDLNGMAVVNACQTLLERLDPIIQENPKGSWEDWVKAAYLQRISLSTTGFYKTPGISGIDFSTGKGKPFSYFSYGTACSEVEIDCLTGDHQVLRTDIVMDVGVSLNPAIDIGQIEGGFMQGYGLMMLEQQKMSSKGFLFTKGPGTYKIPSFGDIPVKFNVSLLKGSVNEKAVCSSKAIGEPPLFLASSVFFAVKDAISSARADMGHHGNFTLMSPATPERIRMACEDNFTKQFPPAQQGTYTPWFVEL